MVRQWQELFTINTIPRPFQLQRISCLAALGIKALRVQHPQKSRRLFYRRWYSRSCLVDCIVDQEENVLRLFPWR